MPSLIEFEIKGSRSDKVSDVKELAKQRLIEDFPEVAKAFSIQKLCVNGTTSLPDDYRLSTINGSGKLFRFLTLVRAVNLSVDYGTKRRGRFSSCSFTERLTSTNFSGTKGAIKRFRFRYSAAVAQVTVKSGHPSSPLDFQSSASFEDDPGYRRLLARNQGSRSRCQERIDRSHATLKNSLVNPNDRLERSDPQNHSKELI